MFLLGVTFYSLHFGQPGVEYVNIRGWDCYRILHQLLDTKGVKEVGGMGLNSQMTLSFCP